MPEKERKRQRVREKVSEWERVEEREGGGGDKEIKI